MPMQVRSDFKVTLKLRDAHGKTRTVGSYDAENVSSEGDEGAKVIPHLQRLTADGRWLASFDADHMRIDLRALDGSRDGQRGSLARPWLVPVTGVQGTVRQFRSLEAIHGFVVVTDQNTYLLPFDPASGAEEITASPIFDPATAADRQVFDTRILPEGLIAYAREYVDGDRFWYRGEVYWVRVADDSVQDLVALVPAHLSAMAANVRSDGRIVVALSTHDHDVAEALGQGDLNELWTIETPPDGIPQVTQVHGCADSYCNVVNWTPGTRRLTYAIEDQVIREAADPEAEPLRLTLELGDEWGGRMHTLWADRDEQRLLAANLEGVQVWDAEGVPLWQWQDPQRRFVSFADFDTDGSILVGAGTSLYRVRDGQAERLLRARGKYKPGRFGVEQDYGPEGWSSGSKQSFIDDAIALPDGSIAFSVVDVDETWESVDEHWEETMELPDGDVLSEALGAPAPPVPATAP